MEDYSSFSDDRADSAIPSEAFPEQSTVSFKDGDVTIVLSQLHILRMHSEVLKRNSALFDEILTDDVKANLTNKARKDGRTPFRVELVNPPEVDELGILTGTGRFVALKLDDKGKPLPELHQPRAPALFPNAQLPNPIFDYYAAILATFYAKAFKVSYNSDLTSLLPHAYGIICLTEYLAVKEDILQPIEISFLGHGQMLYRSISNQPLRWLDLACKMKSVLLFREAVIHVIGRWNGLQQAEKDGLDDYIRMVCEKKHAKVQEFKRSVELAVVSQRLPKLSPEFVDAEEKRKGLDVRKHAVNTLSWMAQSCWQQWLLEQLADGAGRNSPDGGYEFYKKLATGGDAYAGVDYQVQYCSLTTRGRGGFVQCMDELKSEASGRVKGLMKSTLQLDLKRFPVAYLTCFTIKPQHCPWLAE